MILVKVLNVAAATTTLNVPCTSSIQTEVDAKPWDPSTRPADQKMSFRKRTTTISPIRKIAPMVPPINFNILDLFLLRRHKLAVS